MNSLPCRSTPLATSRARQSVRRQASAGPVDGRPTASEHSSSALSKKVITSVAACSGAALADPLMSLVCLCREFIVNLPLTRVLAYAALHRKSSNCARRSMFLTLALRHQACRIFFSPRLACLYECCHQACLRAVAIDARATQHAWGCHVRAHLFLQRPVVPHHTS